jgi:F0F1-type ATP synthase assembly protein I
MKKTGPDADNWKYAQTGLQLAAGVMLGFAAGYWLDGRLGTSPWLMLGGSAGGLAAGFYLFIREVFYKDGK